MEAILSREGEETPEGEEDPGSDILIHKLTNVQKPLPEYKDILLLGDSFMVEGLGPVLEKRLKEIPDLKVDRAFRSATGLVRSDYFDWFTFFGEQLEQKDPSLVIVCLGANDTQDIVSEDRKRSRIDTPEWEEQYALRVERLLSIAEERDVRVIWIGLPIMGKEHYNKRIYTLNEVVSKVCSEKQNCRFFSSFELLSDSDGKFSPYVTLEDKTHERIRTKDSIHVTELGASMIVDAFFQKAGGWGIYGLDSTPDLQASASPPAAGDDDSSVTSLTPDAETYAAAESSKAPPGYGELLIKLPEDLPPDYQGSPPSLPALDSQGLAGPEGAGPAAANQEGASQEGEIQEGASLPRLQESPGPAAQSSPDAQTAQSSPDSPAASAASASQAAQAASEEDFLGHGRLLKFPISLPKLSDTPFALSLPAEEAAAPAPATIVEVNLPSKARAKETNYLIYLPGPDEIRPTVFLLHGAKEDYLVWRERYGKDLLTLAKELNLNFVMPDGDPYGWYLDSPLKKNSRLEYYIMEELWPDLMGRFTLDPTRVGILGINMGGHGALTLALKRPGAFKAVSSISGVTDLELHGAGNLFEDLLRLKDVLGPYREQSQAWQNNSAYFLTRKSPENLKGTALILSVGTSDPVTLAENRQYHRLLSDLALPHEYREERGDHSWTLWKEKVPEHLAFLSKALNGP
jgi:S-formylglutathione hydrolase FrmB/lysophospholipase L1-like esterase